MQSFPRARKAVYNTRLASEFLSLISCLPYPFSPLQPGSPWICCNHVRGPQVLRPTRQCPQPDDQLDCRSRFPVGFRAFLPHTFYISPAIADLSKSLFGYDQGVTGGLLDLPSFTKYFPDIHPDAPGLSHAVKSSRSSYQGIAVASYNLGCFLGAVFTIFIGNPLGRKKTIFYGSIVMTVGALLQCTSYQLPQLILGRIVTGWGNGMNTSTVRMFYP